MLALMSLIMLISTLKFSKKSARLRHKEQMPEQSFEFKVCVARLMHSIYSIEPHRALLQEPLCICEDSRSRRVVIDATLQRVVDLLHNSRPFRLTSRRLRQKSSAKAVMVVLQ